MKRFHCIALVVFVLLAGCQGPAERPAPAPASDVPVAATDGARYLIDADASWLHVRVYKSGRLARFGHNHIISSHAIAGTLMLTDDPTQSTLSLQLPLADFVVDDPRWRAQNGDDFPGEIKEADRAGTRVNMLSDKLLNAAVHPVMRIDSTAIEKHAEGFSIRANVALAGANSTLAFPVTVNREDGVVRAEGELTIAHDQLGLTPFSALLGALKVADEIGVSYHLVAKQVEPAS